MIRQPENYGNVNAVTSGEAMQLSAGGHVCKILKAEEVTQNFGSGDIRRLVLYFDIVAPDPAAGYFKENFENRKRFDANAKWSGVYRQTIDGNGTAYFKGMIAAIEKSNPGYVWNWDEGTLVGKLFGGVFGREEFIGRDGSSHWTTRCSYIRDVNGVMDADAPREKPYNGSRASARTENVMQGYTEVHDSELPF